MNDPVREEATSPLNWPAVVLFTLTTALAFTVLPWYMWTHHLGVGAWVFFGLVMYATGLSITGGYHRLWSHRAYEAHWSLRVFYMLFGAMALQNSILIWGSMHRVHHKNVDDVDGDPYSINRGFWFAHMGWMLRNYPSGKIDFSNARDLQADPIVMFQHRHYLGVALGMNIGFPLLVGALCGDPWGFLMLGGVLRLFVNHHFTFFINSLAHMWGTRPYTEENSARDNPVLAVVTYGEGYHNFHHIFAHDYRNGVRWWQWDPTKWLIGALSLVGLTRRLKRTPDFQIQKALLAMQFTRAQASLAKYPAETHSHLEPLRARLAHEYENFLTAIAEWARVKEEWLGEKKRAVLEQWDQVDLQSKLREIERRLNLQRRRLRILHAELA
jgi:stearoyl-CoA desaturase (delta-9 desaturase)